jgi:hypothetical protein
VTVELNRLGVRVTSEVAADGCSIVRAQVALDTGGSIAVAVRGATRGSEGRIVSDAALAAAWIDSWTRDDIDKALWAAPPATTSATTSASRVAVTGPSNGEPLDLAPANARVSRWDSMSVSAGYEQTWTDDDVSWQGVSAAACGRLGVFCVGARVRAAFDPDRLYNSTGVARSDLSVMATASAPLSVGAMSIAPELGVGVGRLVTRRSEGTCKLVMTMNCNPMDPMCVPEAGMCDPNNPGTTMSTKLFVGDNFSATTYTPRIALALRVAVPLFRHVWLDGLAGLTYSPLSHTSAFETPSSDPALANAAISMPGEPSSGYVLGVGIRVGAK